MNTSSTRRGGLVAAGLALTVAATAGGALSASTPPSGSGADISAEWQAILDAAADEGEVTLFSAQPLSNLEEFERVFEEAYPEIDLEAIRLTDADSTPRLEIEMESGAPTADMWVIYSATTIAAKAEAGWFVDPVGPGFSAAGYLPEYLHDGGAFEVGAAVLTFGWNTDRYPQGLTDFTDLLDPELADGEIGTLDATVSPSAVDFYYFLEETYGAEFVEALGAQNPRLYPSALPIGESLAAGEISVAAFTLPLTVQMANGAPVDFALAETTWGTRAYATLLDGAANPNAAQVLADFMVSPVGQEAIAHDQSAVLPDVPGTLTTNDQVRVQDLEALTPEKIEEYLVRWQEMFG